ncbi:MAG: C1 family peptidase [Polyangiaceae bacterium]
MRRSPALFAVAALSTLACARSSNGPQSAQAWPSGQQGPKTPIANMPPGSNVQAMDARSCNPKEVAPGVVVSFDCGQHADVTRAIAPMFKKSFVTGPLPPLVDHRMTGLEGPVKSQGAVGTCTAVSLSSAMDHAVRKMGRGDVVSALHIWSKYAVSSMGVAGDQTEGEKIALEPSWPYDPAKACKLLRQPFDSCAKSYKVTPGTGDLDPAMRAERTAANGAGRYTISAIEQLQSKPPNLDEMAAVLAGGDAIWISFHVDSDAWTSGNMLPGAVLPNYDRRETEGHAVLLAGYRNVGVTRQFLIHNSWGPRWGDGGYAWINGEMVMKHTRAAYKVRVSDGGGGGPSPNPAPNGCPAGQAPDSVLGSCAPICASGSAPAAGVCLPTIPGLGAPGGLPSIPGMPAPGALPVPLPFPIPGVTPPSQPSQPAPSQCAQGQVRDVVTGQCMAPCAGGSPPAGGLCMPALPSLPR